MQKYKKSAPTFVMTYRNKKYIKYVASLPSCISGRPADDAHHIKGRGYGGTTKCSDLYTIPLTREEHDELHRQGWVEWEARYGDQRDFVLETIQRAVDEKVQI